MKITQAVILAAGESSRFWPLNHGHKCLIAVLGRPLIWHTLDGLKKSGVDDVVIVQGPDREIEKSLKEYQKDGFKINYVAQPKPVSTGDALFRAKSFIKGPFIVSGPHKVDIGGYLPDLINKFKGRIVLAGTETSSPWEFGIVKFNGKDISEVVENPVLGKEPSNIKTNETYLFPKEIFSFLKSPAEKEDSLIDAINLFIKEKGADLVLLERNPVSLKYPWNVFEALEFILHSDKHKGEVMSSASVGKNVVISGEVHIGENTVIGDNTVISGPCFIGDNCKIGPGNVIRGPLSLENNILTGAFFEIKHSVVQKGTHFHSGYIGDSVVGEGCRFGAGFITANRRLDRKNIYSLIKGKKTDSGLTYFGAIVGNNSSFGIHSGTMPGVLIGSNCVIGPSSVVFENIPDQTVFFSEFKGNSVDRKNGHF